ncbi:MAG TPA: peptide chain release factor N(5)-glutamine methyltransferase [Sphingobacteriaceae bacterium]
MMTFGDAEKMFVEQLAGLYEPEESRALASIALGHLCRLSRGQLLLRKNEALDAQTETSAGMILQDLVTGKPLQYILGETEFYGLRFLVNPSVLIPRPETEELVDWILEDTGDRPDVKSLLDIGTGSGCIPIAIKNKRPDIDVAGIDISPEALETAMRNSVLNKAAVTFRQVDILNDADKLKGYFSVIVSNPPYITYREKVQMHPNVLRFEPHTALFVEDRDALLFYRRIGRFASTHLEPGGRLFFEINEHHGAETVLMLEEQGFTAVELRKDLNGKDRMIKATRVRTADETG